MIPDIDEDFIDLSQYGSRGGRYQEHLRQLDVIDMLLDALSCDKQKPDDEEDSIWTD